MILIPEGTLQPLTGGVNKGTREKSHEKRGTTPEGQNITAKIALSQHGTQAPYFCITGRTQHSGGRLDDEIAAAFPELAPFQKWNLCSIEGPLHYIANSVYHAKNGHLEYFRGSAIWPEATEADMKDENLAATLAARLPSLMVEFEAALKFLKLI